MEQPETDEQKAVADNGRSYLGAVKALHGHEQSERNVAVTRSKRHDLTAAAVRPSYSPTEAE